MSKRIYAYECSYCGKLFKTDFMSRRHETGCLKNPERQNCVDCIHFNPKYRRKFKDGEIHEIAYCMKLDKRCSKSTSYNCSEYKNSNDALQIR